MGDNRRKSYRYPASEGAEKVTLNHDGVDYPVTVVNLSAEGFRLSFNVESDKSPNVAAGDVALLTTDNGRHEVRVANVNRETGALQLGVIRLKDFHDPTTRSRREYDEDVKFSGRRAGSPTAWPVAQCLMLAGVVAMIVVAYSLFFSPGTETTEPAPAQRKRTASNREAAGHAWRPTQDPLEAAAHIVRHSNPTSRAFGAGRTVEPGTSNQSGTPSEDMILPQGSGATAEAGSKRPEVSADRSSVANQDVAAPASGIADGNAGWRPVLHFDAKSEGSTRVVAALKRATREKKHVLVEFGTATSDACVRLHDLLTTNADISVSLKNVVLVSLDWGANQAMTKQLTQDGRPLDPPVLTLLDQDGKVLRSQWLQKIEDGRKVDVEKVKAFLQQDRPAK